MTDAADDIKQMLDGLGFNDLTTAYLVEEEGLNSADALKQLDSSMILDLAKSCRKANTQQTASTTRVRKIGVFQQKALKQVAFYINYKLMTSREGSQKVRALT